MAKSTIIAYAPDAYKLLKGVCCLYKPANVSFDGLKNRLLGKVCQELNIMKVRPPEKYVEIKEDSLSETGLTVVNVPSVADNPLVVGPRYQPKDFKFSGASQAGYHTSGLYVLGLQSDRTIKEIRHANLLRVYQITGKLGRATDTFHEEGNTIEKSTYGHVSRFKIDKVLAAIQSANQRQMFHYMGIDIKTQAAYELASQGLIRPAEGSPPVLYGIRCNDFQSPHFTIEVQCIHETEAFLLSLINDVGLELKTNACCSKIRQTRYGNFTLYHALLMKHWTVEHIINNIISCSELVAPEQITPATANLTSNLQDPPQLQIDAH